MTVYYFDTSALLKRYVTEVGSVWVRSTCLPASGHTIMISRLTRVELLSGLAKGHRSGTLDAHQFTQLIGLVQRDLRDDYQQTPMHGSVYALAGKLITTYYQEGLRAFDAMQLACALQERRRREHGGGASMTFVAADTILLAVAMWEGLPSVNPLTPP